MRVFIVMCFVILSYSCVNEKPTYMCDICEMHFEDREWAVKCEDWCKTYNSCNSEITKHSLELKK